jgi:hypothetical protein
MPTRHTLEDIGAKTGISTRYVFARSRRLGAPSTV